MRNYLVLRVAAKIVVPFMLLFALYVQFHGDFGTRPVAGSPLGYALLGMTLILLAGAAITVIWLRRSGQALRRD